MVTLRLNPPPSYPDTPTSARYKPGQPLGIRIGQAVMWALLLALVIGALAGCDRQPCADGCISATVEVGG